MDISHLLGKVLISIKGSVGDSCIEFTLSDGSKYKLAHEQDCCEIVYVEDICGDLADLIGEPILLAEEVSNKDREKIEYGVDYDSYTWTFYKLATNKGFATVRWYGTSNGYYAETAKFGPIA